jgi:hypothetical protein
VKITPQVQRKVNALRDRLMEHLQEIDDETAELVADLRGEGFICEMNLEISKGASMSEDCHDSDNMPTHRLQTPAHTCKQDRNSPCDACAVFAPFRRGDYNDFRQGPRPESTNAVEAYRPRPEPELDLTSSDIAWLHSLKIKVTD